MESFDMVDVDFSVIMIMCVLGPKLNPFLNY